MAHLVEQERHWPGEPGLGGVYGEEELEALVEVYRSMPSWTHHYDRRFQETFESEFAAGVGVPHAVSVNSGGVALDLAVRCLDADEGDEVLSCALNFPGTHLAVIGRGLRLVLCEPDPRTLNLDAAEIGRRMTRRTRGVLVTHMNGLPADLAAIGAAVDGAAGQLGIPVPPVIVDAARAQGAATPEGPVGGQGWITVFSFHRKKLMTTLGEGGMLVTACGETAGRLRRLRSFGDKATWGSNYRMTEFQAAVGSVQLRRLDALNDARIRLARERSRRLAGVAGWQSPPEPDGFRHVFYLYTLVVAEGAPPDARDRLVDRLERRHRVGSVIANPPTYATHRLIARATADQGPFPVADGMGRRLFCPALHPLMADEDNARIGDALVGCAEALGLA
jgi:perosamine synthetase